MATPEDIQVQFSEAIEFLRRRLAIGADEWMRILEAEGATSSAIADDTVRSLVEDLAQAVLESIENGTGYETFRAQYEALVQARGWAYKGDAGWHSQLIFRLHTQTAYAAGRWEQNRRLEEQTPQIRRYWRYITAGDHRVRPNHRAWHGVILPTDHPFWQTHFPPNGFNCRCHAQSVTDRSLKRYGWTVTADDDPRLAIPPDEGWDYNPGALGERLRQRD